MKPIGSKELLRLRLIRWIEELDEPDEEIDSDEARGYHPGMGRVEDVRDFYLPRVPKNWYYDPSVFCKLLGMR